MKVQLLPSSFDKQGAVSQHQRLTCFVVNDSLAVDAGSLAFSCSDRQREQIRDIVISHTHLDHIAGLPIFLDDLFAALKQPIRIHATKEMAEVLERDIFNWAVYPRFSELKNENGNILEYHCFEPGTAFNAAGLEVTPVLVNHVAPSAGFLISDQKVTIGFTGDTAETDEIWDTFSSCKNLKAIFVECAFPDEMESLALASHHLTPQRLLLELGKCGLDDFQIFVSNIKPMYREKVVEQLASLSIRKLQIVEVGKIYEF